MKEVGAEFTTWFDINFDYTDIVIPLLHLTTACLLSLPIAWNREKDAHSAGLRTFPLVAMSTCAFMLIGNDMFASDGARARVMQGVITGIGFIGGGAILKTDHNITGTATAASLWATGAIGVAVALNRMEIAIAISLFTFLTLLIARFYKR